MSSVEHKRMVKKIIDEFESKGLRIGCADYNGYNTCDKTNGYIPDVRAKDDSNELNYIGEAETCDTVKSDHTKEQIKAFSGRIMMDGKSKDTKVPFYIAVPKECESDLEEVLQELGLADKQNITRWHYS